MPGRNEANLPKLYNQWAWLWPLISPPADYGPEAACVRDCVHEHLGPPPRGGRWSLVELGSGGGHSLCHLSGEFDVVGVDLSPEMVALSRRLNPGVEHIVADMRDVHLGRQFDITLCHDAIDYMCTEAQLWAALATAAAHTRPGGLLLVAPTYTAEQFEDGQAAFDVRGDESRRVTYLSYVHDPDPSDTQHELVMAIIAHDLRTGRIDVLDDRHTCGLFPLAQWLGLIEQSGFKVLDEGVEVLSSQSVAEKPSPPFRMMVARREPTEKY